MAPLMQRRGERSPGQPDGQKVNRDQSEGVHADASEPPALRFRSVRKTFFDRKSGAFPALRGVDLDIPEGSFVCLIGPSGCGKSTLLNLAAGLDRPTGGIVEYRGRPVTGVNTDVGYLTQHHNLLPWRSVAKNIALALEIQNVPRAERRRRVEEVLALVGLEGAANKYPAQLSGGMQRRTALARLLVYKPTTLLMDEPFGALDAQLRLQLQRELLSIWAQTHSTVVFVTHDLEEAILLGDIVVVFGKNPGRIVHVETIDIERPRDLIDLRGRPDFTARWDRLWQKLEPQLDEEGQP